MKRSLTTAMILAALALAGCGGGSSSTSTTSEAAGTAATSTAPSASAETGKPKPEQGSSKPAKPEASGSSKSESGATSFMVKGGDNSIPEYGSEASTSQHDQAEAALKGFLAAKASGNWAKACSYVAAATKKSIEELAAHAKQLKATGCASVLKTLSAGVPKSAGQEEEITSGVASVRVKGNQAFALYHGPHKTDYYMVMIIEGGKFKVNSLAPAAFP